MKVREVRDPAEWQRLASIWNHVLESSASATTFLTWEWMSAWWSAYGNPDDLLVLITEDDDGTVRGIAPLRRQTLRRYGQTFSTLTFVGDGSNDSDYLDFIVERGCERAVMAAFLRHLDDSIQRGVVLRLNEIPTESPNLPVLKELSGGSRLWNEEVVPCATVRLPERWEEYLGSLRPRFRTKIRSVLRHLESRPEIRFGFCENQAQIERLLPALFDLHTRRWNQDGRPGVFGGSAKRKFYGELSNLLLECGALRFSSLEWKDRVVACQYGFVHGHTYLHLQEGYEPSSEHWNVGVGLRAWTFREFLRQGIREYDFLAGVGRHKTDWGADVKESRQIMIAAATSRNQLLFSGPALERRVKDLARHLIPESVLAARRARHEQRPQSPSRPGARERIRRVAAQCYFHLGAPAAVRIVRERYQVGVSPTGGVRELSWRKRRQPAGRILYYHRVNDDRDPFFPSTPVEVFEKQIRFLARRYKVVSLGALVDHLERGSPKTVVAITFDDGYMDNYQRALPILEHYGVPATIFLSTGSLDSREPLWFEVLAGALETTANEFLDLEIDLPRRFWLRTRDERLRANGDLLRLLRHMTDENRQIELAAILRELAAPKNVRRDDKMLTWDQVREMKQRGIDFGGHTVTHPYLSRLSQERLTWEISECKRRIESELQAPVAHFAYPNGQDEDFAPWNKDAIRTAGYSAAVTTLWGLNYQSTDRMELRRGGPWEEDEALFAYRMDWYELVNG